MRFAALFALAAIPAALSAQTPAAPIQPPPVGLLLQYTYWPTQYVQFVGTELPYSMFELDVDNASKPAVYQVTLTTRADHQRIVYSNAESVIAAAKANKADAAYRTDIAVDGADSIANGATTDVRMTMADGKPLLFHFVQGSDMSEQGSGLTDLGASPIPIFAYREQGAVAGEGTALKIGDTVSTADVWKEISRPPYFVAYHGAVTGSAHTLVFVPGQDSFTTVSAPDALKPGGVWELDATNGNHLTLRIDKVAGDRYTLSGSDRFHPSVRFGMDATRATDGTWSLDRLRTMPARDGEKHTMTLTFSPALVPSGTVSTLEITEGKKAKVATASMQLAGPAADRTATVTFTAPAWAAGKTITEETILADKTITYIAKPAAK